MWANFDFIVIFDICDVVYKELSLCPNYDFLIRISLQPYALNLIYQTMNYDRSSNLSLKYHRFTASGCKDVGI